MLTNYLNKLKITKIGIQAQRLWLLLYLRYVWVKVLYLPMILRKRKRAVSYELIAQEFLCSWSSGLETAYFAKYIARSRAQGMVKMLPRVHKTIYTFWDLGVKDPTAIFFVAFDEQNFFIMDYYENTRLGMEHYIEYVVRYKERHNCVFGGHFAPHDMKVQEYSTGETRLDFARKQGINFKVVPKPKSKMHAIDVLRGIFDLFYFNRPKCERVFDFSCSTMPRLIPRGANLSRPMTGARTVLMPCSLLARLILLIYFPLSPVLLIKNIPLMKLHLILLPRAKLFL